MDIPGREGTQMEAFAFESKQLSQGDLIVVECDRQCNVRLLDDLNFNKFRNGQQHRYYGGFYRMFPVRLVVPKTGHWNIVIDLGGNRDIAKYRVHYYPATVHVAA
jgi:hypothetical protein